AELNRGSTKIDVATHPSTDRGREEAASLIGNGHGPSRVHRDRPASAIPDQRESCDIYPAATGDRCPAAHINHARIDGKGTSRLVTPSRRRDEPAVKHRQSWGAHGKSTS